MPPRRKKVDSLPVKKNCLVCGEELHPSIAPILNAHPSCYPEVPRVLEEDPEKAPWEVSSPMPVKGSTPRFDTTMHQALLKDHPFAQSGPSFLEKWIKNDVIDMITWGGRTADRSVQTRIGPSEVGNPCSRAIAYKLWGKFQFPVSAGGGGEEWYSIMGTAVHAWMADMVERYVDAHDLPAPMIETRVDAGREMEGTSDLFWALWENCVVDWKLCGKDVMSEVADAPKPEHKIQANIYGKGISRTGRLVQNCAIVYLPRAGRLKDLVVHAFPFDEKIADAAIDRRWRIQDNLDKWDIDNHPERWNMIPAKPSKSCFFCSYHNSKVEVAGPTGCPGRE